MEEARSRRPSYSQANCIRPIQLPKIYSKVQIYVSMYTYLYVFLHLGGRGPSQAELSYSQAKIHCIRPIRIKMFVFFLKVLFYVGIGTRQLTPLLPRKAEALVCLSHTNAKYLFKKNI